MEKEYHFFENIKQNILVQSFLLYLQQNITT